MSVSVKGKVVVVCSNCGHLRYVDTREHVSDYLITRDCQKQGLR